jgi:phosphoglycolate phosphatase-like HAD superfamily hydrolase
MSKFKAILWDFDGVLFDSHPFITNCMLYILHRSYGIYVNEQWLSDMLKISTSTTMNHLQRKYHLSDEMVEAIKGKFYADIDDSSVDVNTMPMPGIKEVLKYTQEAGIKNFIFTNRGFKAVHHLLKKYDMEDYFDEIRVHDGMMPRKPSPDVVLDIMDIYKLTPADILSVGDRGIDHQTAQAAGGLQTCHFGEDKNSPIQVNYWVADMNALKLLIKGEYDLDGVS